VVHFSIFIVAHYYFFTDSVEDPDDRRTVKAGSGGEDGKVLPDLSGRGVGRDDVEDPGFLEDLARGVPEGSRQEDVSVRDDAS